MMRPIGGGRARPRGGRRPTGGPAAGASGFHPGVPVEHRSPRHLPVTVEASGPTVLFADDFAGGADPAWVIDAPIVVATGGLDLPNTESGSSYAAVNITLPASNIVSLRLDLRQIGDRGANAGSNVLALTSANNISDLVRLFPTSNSNWRFYVIARDFGTDTWLSIALDLRSAAQTLELLYDVSGVAAIGQLYADGVLLATVTETMDWTGIPDPSMVFGGIALAASLDQAFRADNVSVADGPQGV